MTTVPRTLLDLAEVVSADRLRRAFEEADRLRLLDTNALQETIERSQGRRGLRHLAPLLRAHCVSPPPTRRELERRFVELLRGAGLAQPAVNAWLEETAMEVDALWREQRVVVELDGYEFHRSRAAFERDRIRDASLQLAGYRVLRITWRRLTQEPDGVLRDIRTLLNVPYMPVPAVAKRAPERS